MSPPAVFRRLFLLGSWAALGCPAHEPPGRMVFVGVWERAVPVIQEAAAADGVPIVVYSDQQLAGEPLKQAEALNSEFLFVLNLRPESIPSLARWLTAAHKANANLTVLSLDQRGSHAELLQAGLLVDDAEVWKYWRANGATNVKRLFTYVRVKYKGAHVPIEPPVMIPGSGYYEPGREDPFESFAELKAYKLAQGSWKENSPVAGLLIQQSFWVTKDTRVIDAQVRALERHGVNAAVIFGDRQEMVDRLIAETHPDLLVEDRHGAMWNDRSAPEALDVPYLRPISMLGYTLDEWRKDPRGLSSRDVGLFMTLQESWGTIEPVVVGGMVVNIAGFRLHEPEPGGIERFAGRAASWLNLRRKRNAEKRVAIIFYNKGLGKDDLMRGSPTGAFLDGPESLVRFLPRMRDAGYGVGKLPRDSEELIRWVRDGAHNVGPWNQGVLEEMVRRGHCALVPVSRYLHWFNTRLSPARRQNVIQHFGPPPGRLMTVERNDGRFLVIPRIDLGNVILLPQPERGAKQDERLLHSRDVPPPHNYLAFYWWLEEEFHADALLHWGTHGSLELLPGKEAGQSRDDWTDLCAGNLPVINLWIMDNLAEATLSRRRSYAQLVDHMVPPAVGAGVEDQYADLRDDIRKLGMLEPGLLKEQYRKRVAAAAHSEKLDEFLHLDAAGELLSEDGVRRLGDYLNEVQEARTPLTLHVLGAPPEAKYRWQYLAEILGSGFPEHLATAVTPPGELDAEQRTVWLKSQAPAFLERQVSAAATGAPVFAPELRKDIEFGREMDAKLQQAGNEIDGLLRALSGRYIAPGPGPEPIRNPASIPGGRNLYALNPEEIPTRPAWEVGKQLVDELLKRRPVHKVGLDLSGMDTMRDFGVMESQILYLMGVRPVWDRNGLAFDVELIPRGELRRPRVDVFCAMGGLYKENFGSRVKLIDKAIRLVSSLQEDDNYVRRGTLATEARLVRRGMAPGQAASLAAARIFGTKPGNMSGTNILYLIPRSGVWDKDREVADVYIDSMSFAYTGDVWGQKIDGLYQEAIQDTDTLVRVWASNMTSQLSNHHAYEYLGGLSMAVEKLTGRPAEAFIADVRNPHRARLRDFTEVMATTFSTELLNKRWVEGMKEHGYAGAGHVAELVKNTFGWSVTRSDSVADETWREIHSVYVEDRYHLGIAQWMKESNPHAMQEIAATMLEAARKGYWRASGETVANLSRLYAQSVVDHGDSGGLVSGGNHRLAEFVSKALNAPGDVRAAQLAARMNRVLARAQHAPAPGDHGRAVPRMGAPGNRPARAAHAVLAAAAVRRVSGLKLELARHGEPAPPLPELPRALLFACMAALMIHGYYRRQGAL